MAFKVYTLAERPELGENDRVMQLLTAGWPAFVLGDPVALETWPRVTSEFADHHVALVEEPSGRLVGIGFGISFAWDGTPAGLPGGWHGVVAQALADRDAGRTPTAAAALSITIAPTHQGRGLSEQVLLAMRGAAARQGFAVLVAPVRPSLKHRYPLTPNGTLRHLDPSGRRTVGPLAAGALAAGCRARRGLLGVDGDQRVGGCVGGVDGAGVPRQRRVRRRRCACAGHHRPRP